MQNKPFWRIPVSILLTVLAIILLVAGATPTVLHRAVSENTLEKVLEPFDLDNLADTYGRKLDTVLAGRINSELLKLAKNAAESEGYTGDVSAYSDFLTAEDIEECIDTDELKELIASKAEEYCAALRNSKKEASLEAEDLMETKSVKKLQARINSKLATITGSLGATLTDAQLETVLDDILTTYGLKALFNEAGIEKTRESLKDPENLLSDFALSRIKERLIEKVASLFFRSNAVSVVLIVLGCICIAVNFVLRRKELARASMYAIVALTAVAGIFCLEGSIIAAVEKLVSSLNPVSFAVSFSTVTAFIAWCVALVRNLFLNEALWFLLGTVPFWALEAWYFIDKKHVEKMTASVKRRMDYEL